MHGRRLIGLLIVAGIGLAGCSSSESGSQPLSAAGKGGGGDAAAGVPRAPEQEQQAAAGRQQVSQPGVDRKLIRTATLELASPEVAKVTGEARRIAAELGGYAGQEEVRGEQASITLHIPSNQFDKAIGQLSGLVPPEGVKARSQTAEDVTEQLVDLESRVATQRASVQRVRDLLARAQTVNEIVQIESEVTRREAELESLEKRREALSGQVALSKVTLKVRKETAPPAPNEDRSGFLAGLIGGWNAFLDFGGGLLQVLGALLPFLIVLGPLGYLGFIGRRWWRRRDRPLAPAVAQEATSAS